MEVENVVGLKTTVDDTREVEDADDRETLALALDLVLLPAVALVVELPTKLDDSGAEYRRHLLALVGREFDRLCHMKPRRIGGWCLLRCCRRS